MDEWLKIIGALGGLEAIRFTVTFLANRKTNARKEKATADSMELQNLLSIIDNLNKQIERYDERLKQRDEKVDTIYREWRTAQAEAQNWMRKYYELELAFKDAEHNRCSVICLMIPGLGMTFISVSSAQIRHSIACPRCWIFSCFS